MVTNIQMPKFGLSMEEGTIVSWFVDEGDTVTKGQEIAEINSEKITNTVEAPVDGILRKILVEADETAACGVNIAIIADMNEDISGSVETSKEVNNTPINTENVIEPSVSKSSFKNTSEINITPRAKKVAEEKGIDYTSILGTGIGGAITISDLKQYVVSGKEKEKPVDTSNFVPQIQEQPVKEANQTKAAPIVLETNQKKMSPMQSAIAKKMFESLSSTAQATIATDVDVSDLVKLYNNSKEKYRDAGYKLSYTAILIKAMALALEKYPKLRTRIVSGNILETSSEINIGVAVAIEDGLVVPVIKDANKKDVKKICRELSDLTDRAKMNQITLDEMTGGVITLTNLGMYDIKYFTPVLNIPESAILGVGAINKQLVSKDGGIFTSSIMNMSLTHDHRIIDGVPAAKFLQEIKYVLSDFSHLL